MLSNRGFLKHEIPYSQLEKLGITKNGFLKANKEVEQTFMAGGFTPLLQLEVKGKNHTYAFLGKIRMTREPKGGVSIEVMPLRTRTPYDDDLQLDESEMEHLRNGLILKKDSYTDNKKTTYYAQLDGETNAVLKVRARDVAIPSVVRNVDLNKLQREMIRDGIPVEIDSNGTPYTIGIDLLQPSGYRVFEGNEDDWNDIVTKEWDRMNPDEIGFWMTDENGWEYQELMDSELQGADIQYVTEDDVKLEIGRSGGIRI